MLGVPRSLLNTLTPLSSSTSSLACNSVAFGTGGEGTGFRIARKQRGSIAPVAETTCYLRRSTKDTSLSPMIATCCRSMLGQLKMDDKQVLRVHTGTPSSRSTERSAVARGVQQGPPPGWYSCNCGNATINSHTINSAFSQLPG